MAEVLALLRQQSPLVLRDYLWHQVTQLHTEDAALHTELLLLLADAALQLMPPPDPGCAPLSAMHTLV